MIHALCAMLPFSSPSHRPVIRMRLVLSCFIFIGMVMSAIEIAYAEREVVKRSIPDARMVGTGRLTFWLWDVYDATLYAPQGTWHMNKPYALSLSYLRPLNGRDIATRSIEEIRSLGFDDEKTIQAWQDAMIEIFPDVDEQTTLTGVRDSKGHTLFYSNGTLLGRIDDPTFSQWFFGIWLSPKSPEPQLREQLLNLRP
ncbi:MAG: chalcone isomerase family protein [Alphaproteobacteria bacterium GM7ARS4]|nr:chalcone isomerase family protein [Alphaproteobacteria bacterium GM7ARS4]